VTEDRPSKKLEPQPKSELDGRAIWSAWERSIRYTRRLPAWALSFLLHLALCVVLLLFVRVAQRGGAMEPARGASIILTRDVDGEAQYFSDADSESDSAATGEASQNVEGALPDAQQMPLDLTGMLPAERQEVAGEQMGNSLPSANQLAGGAPAPRGQIGGNEARTSIFGAEGTGNKFVYVFDRSSSMAAYQGRPLAAAKRELIASLHDLDKMQQFQILFYNDSQYPTVFNPLHPQPPRMLFGNEQTRRLAQGFVEGVVANGGTQHMAALKFALGMNPDVIFFLTDAAEPQLTVAELDEIRRQNARVGATIIAIEFGSGPQQSSLSFLKRLARQNGGQYVYVDVTRLPSAR
jgi:Mg-chelatase subunit ChlD